MTSKERPLLSLDEILAGEPDVDCLADPFAEFVGLTPRALSMLSLCECKEQLARHRENPLRLALAAKSAHLAMQAALIDALAGPASIGAYPEKERVKWLTYFNGRHDETEPPAGDFVMNFKDLLDRATAHPLEWVGRPLVVSPDESDALERLTFVRNRIEHVRPETHLIDRAFIIGTLPVAARLTLELLDVCGHYFEEDERATAAADVAAILGFCDQAD